MAMAISADPEERRALERELQELERLAQQISGHSGEGDGVLASLEADFPIFASVARLEVASAATAGLPEPLAEDGRHRALRQLEQDMRAAGLSVPTGAGGGPSGPAAETGVSPMAEPDGRPEARQELEAALRELEALSDQVGGGQARPEESRPTPGAEATSAETGTPEADPPSGGAAPTSATPEGESRERSPKADGARRRRSE